MNVLTFALAAACMFATPLHAQQADPVSRTSFNAALTSDYRYRGISQTRLEPALQGGLDYTHPAMGWYAGTWLSTINWTKDAGGGGDVEWDVYAGRRGELGGGLSYDAGLLGYLYPDNGLKHLAGFANADTLEAYVQLGRGPAYAKYSLSLTNLFGFVDSRRSGYLDLGANIEVAPGLILNLHVGRQRVRNNPSASYADWRLGLSRELGFATGSLALVGTNAGKDAYASPADGKFLGREAVVAGLSRTF